MHLSQRAILARHAETLQGRLRLYRLRSEALGIAKPYYVYTPPRPPVALLYLFRGHEREYVNFVEDGSRRFATAIEDLDRHIADGRLPPVTAILPGLNSSNNYVPSLGIDMVGAWPASMGGLGTGRFWTYLTQELIPHVEARWGLDGPRLAAGFSLGGFTVSLLAALLPGYLAHAGMYDALFTWPDHHDPRVRQRGANTDPVWMEHLIFDAALGRPRHLDALARWNPLNRILDADGAALDALRATTYWIKCASGDGSAGNRDRAYGYRRLLKQRGFTLGFKDVLFHPDAAHAWHWNDRFVVEFLRAALAEKGLAV